MLHQTVTTLGPEDLKRRKAERLLAARKRRTLRIRQRVAAIGVTLSIATYGIVAFTDETASTTVATAAPAATATPAATDTATEPESTGTTADESAAAVTTQAS